MYIGEKDIAQALRRYSCHKNSRKKKFTKGGLARTNDESARPTMFDPATGQPIGEPAQQQPVAPPLAPPLAPQNFTPVPQKPHPGLGAMREPKNLVRLIAFFCSLVAFSAAASASNMDEAKVLRAAGYGWSAYEFVQAANILLWLWSGLQIADALFDMRAKLKPGLPYEKVELVIDGTLLFFVFIAFIACAAELNSSVCNLSVCMDMWDVCKTANLVQNSDFSCPASPLAASAAFSFFGSCVMVFSVLVSFKAYQATRADTLPPTPPAQAGGI